MHVGQAAHWSSHFCNNKDLTHVACMQRLPPDFHDLKSYHPWCYLLSQIKSSLNVGMLEVQNSSSQQYGTTTVNESLCINQHSSQDCKLQTIDKFVRPYKTSLSIAGNFCSTKHQPHPPSHGGYQNNTSLCCSNPNVPPTHSYSRECELQLLYVATAAKCCS